MLIAGGPILLFALISIANLVMWIVSWVHIFTHKNYERGNRVLWLILTAACGFIASIFYFAIGRGYNDKPEE